MDCKVEYEVDNGLRSTNNQRILAIASIFPRGLGPLVTFKKLV